MIWYQWTPKFKRDVALAWDIRAMIHKTRDKIADHVEETAHKLGLPRFRSSVRFVYRIEIPRVEVSAHVLDGVLLRGIV